MRYIVRVTAKYLVQQQQYMSEIEQKKQQSGSNSNSNSNMQAQLQLQLSPSASTQQQERQQQQQQQQQENINKLAKIIKEQEEIIVSLKRQIGEIEQQKKIVQEKLKQSQNRCTQTTKENQVLRQKIEALKENNQSILHTFQVFQREFIKRDYKNGINIPIQKQKTTNSQGPFFLQLIRNVKEKFSDQQNKVQQQNSPLNQFYGFFFNQDIDQKQNQLFGEIMQKKQLTKSSLSKIKNYGRKNYLNQKHRNWAWYNITSKSLCITQKLYSHLCNCLEQNSLSLTLSPPMQQKLTLIDRDLNRMDLKLDDQKQKIMKTSIKKCLQLFELYRPDIGYVQGMSYLAWMLLIRMGQFQAFSSFGHLVLCDQFVNVLYFFKQEGIKRIKEYFQKCLQDKKPKLLKHLKNLQVQFELFIIQWAYTMFSRAFNLRITSKIWDLWLCEDYHTFFKVALVIFDMLQTQILQLNQNDKIIQLIKSQTHKLDEVQFLKNLRKQKVPDQLELAFL